MNKVDRVRAAFHRQPVDRVPVSFWRHFPEEDQTAAGLTRAVAAFHRKHDFDLVKVTPASDYIAVDWGLAGEYRGSLEGTREVLHRPVNSVADWDELGLLDPCAGSLGRQIDSLWMLKKELMGEAPILETIFSPLSTARKLSGDLWRDCIVEHPDVLHHGLGVIAESTARFAVEAIRAGADGIFYATQVASRALLTEGEHKEFGERYDRVVLDRVAAHTDLVLLHLHGSKVMFEVVERYPVAAVNWHDRRTSPSLNEALGLVAVGLVGGLNELDTLLEGSPEQVGKEAANAVTQTAGRGLMLGAGCVVRINTPEANISAAVKAAHSTSKGA